MRLLRSVLDFLRALLQRGPKPRVQTRATAPGKPRTAPAGKKRSGPDKAPEAFAFAVKLDPAKAKSEAKPAANPARAVVLQTEARPAKESAEAAPAELDLKLAGERKEKRKAFRVSIRGLTVACAELEAAGPAVDLSALGIGFQHGGPHLKAGTPLTLTLELDGKALAEGLQAKVVRHEQGVVGAAFQDLTRPQEDHVYKIVLEAQRGTLVPGQVRDEAAKAGHKTHAAQAHQEKSAPAKPQQPATPAAARPAQPAQPTAKPAQPAPAGARPAQTPAQPVARPTQPAAKPVQPTTKPAPAAPAGARPAQATANPAAARPAQPVQSAAKPAQPVARPQQPGPQQAQAAKPSPETSRK